MAHDDDHDDHDDDHDDDEGGPEAAEPHVVLEMLQGAIDRGEKVRFVRAGFDTESWNGFPLMLGDDLVLVRTLDDFRFDGFAVLRLRDVSAVRSGDDERFFERVLRAEGLFEHLAPPKPILLQSMRTVIESVRAHYRYAILECEGNGDEAFFLGEIARVDDEYAWLHYIQVNGTREREASRVPLDEVTTVRFDEQYVNLFGKHCTSEDRH